MDIATMQKIKKHIIKDEKGISVSIAKVLEKDDVYVVTAVAKLNGTKQRGRDVIIVPKKEVGEKSWTELKAEEDAKKSYTVDEAVRVGSEAGLDVGRESTSLR